MAPELVLPSPPSDGGLARGRGGRLDETLEPCGEGGDRTTLPLLQLVEVGVGARRLSRR